MFLLDTDHLIILQLNTRPEVSRLRDRLAQHAESEFFLSIVSVHEQMIGANKYLARAKKPAELARGYSMIEEAMIDYQQYQVLPFDEPCARCYDTLRQQGLRVGAMDLRIAAVALSHDYTVLTRNTVDFERVPNLRVDDWTTDLGS